MISMSCPGCGAKLKAADESVGKRTKCPKCGTEVTVTEPIYDAEAVPGMGDVIDPYGFDDPKPKPLASASDSAGGEARRPCPMCGEMILASAAKCRFCNEIFDPKLKKADAKKKGRSSGGGDDDMSTGDWAVAILCSGIGCIAGIVWMIQGKEKGKKMVGVSLLFVVIWSAVRFAVESSMRNQQ